MSSSLRELERRISELEARVLQTSGSGSGKYSSKKAYNPLFSGPEGSGTKEIPAAPGATQLTTATITGMIKAAAKSAVWSEIEGVDKPEDGATVNNIFMQDAEPSHDLCVDGDLWFDTNDNNKPYRYSLTTDTFVSVRDGMILALGDDGLITPLEKLAAKLEWDAIVVEGNASTGLLVVKATALGKSHSSFDSAYSALDTYLNTTLAVFADMDSNTTVTRSTWDTKWKDYYAARTALSNSFLGALAPRDTVNRTYIEADSITVKSTDWKQAAVSGSYVTLSQVLNQTLDDDDALLLLVTGNSPGTGVANYRISRAQDYDWEIAREFVNPIYGTMSMTALMLFTDGYQPYIINEKAVTDNQDLYGGTGTNEAIAQIFQSKSSHVSGSDTLVAVEFYVGYNGSPTANTITCYLYDSDGSTVGSNLLATGASWGDTKNPLIGDGGLGWCQFSFSTPYTMVTSTYYAIVFERSARDSSNHWEFYEGPAKSNSVALKRSSSTWSTIAGIDDFAFKIYTLQSTTGWDFKLQASSDSGDIRAILDYVALRR